jgi:hypothetical protein
MGKEAMARIMWFEGEIGFLYYLVLLLKDSALL